MPQEMKNVARMELAELINYLTEAKVVLKGPGTVALRVCECCINVTMPAPGEEVMRKVEVIDPRDASKTIALSIK
jgi:hypothetical protein